MFYPMTREFRILILGHKNDEAALIESVLHRADFPFTSLHVSSREKFEEALGEYAPELILCDYGVPGLTGEEALELAKSETPETPVIFVSGKTGEEVVIDLLKRGATDYVFKDRLWPRLIVAVRRALHDVEEHTIRMDAERELRESEERFRSLSASSPVGIFLADTAGGCIYANPRFRSLFGFTLRETMGFGWAQSVHPEERVSVLEDWHASARQGLEFSREFRLLLANDLVRWVLMRSCPMRSDAREPDGRLRTEGREVVGHVGTVEDITNRKRAEQRVAIQYAVTRVLAESGAWDNAAASVLQSVCKELGWPLGQRWRVDRPDDRIRWVGAWNSPSLESSEFVRSSRTLSFARGESLPGQVWANGQPVWITDISDIPQFQNALAAEKLGLRSALGLPILAKGEVVEVLTFFSSPVLHADDELLAVMSGLCTQIAQFMERKHLEQQFLQAQKMEAFGKLAGGVAHDFNNLLTVIAGYGEIVSAGLDPNDPKHGYVGEITKAAERATALTRQLLAFTRQQVLTPRVLNLNDVISDVSKMLRRLIGADVEMVVENSVDLGSVRADPGQLEQVIMNLAVNARDAMPGGGTLKIRTANASVSEAGPVPRGRYVLLSVADTGVGMNEQIRPHIFEPFFTTKPVGQGTGLGLATCYGIITQSGGHIAVTSAPGRGARFDIYLPRVDEQSEHMIVSEEPGKLPHGTESILVVEHDSAVRRLAVSVLKQLDYDVLEAANGDEAFTVAQSQSNRPLHLMITNMVLPQTNGRELAQLIRSIHPDTRVLFTSGHLAMELNEPGFLREQDSFMPKPLLPGKLALQVRAMLDR